MSEPHVVEGLMEVLELADDPVATRVEVLSLRISSNWQREAAATVRWMAVGRGPNMLIIRPQGMIPREVQLRIVV